MNDHNIIKVLQEFNLSRRDIEENWIEFLDYKEDLDVCIGCKSLKSCPKISKGMVRLFNYQDGEVKLSLQPCRYGQAHFDDQKILNDILRYKSIVISCLLVDSYDIMMFCKIVG